MGHYSPAIVHNGLVYVSGQIAVDPSYGKLPSNKAVEVQTRQVLNNIVSILEKHGSDKLKIIKTTVFTPDIIYWTIINEVYSNFFGDYKPARTVVPTTSLHHNALVEIEAIAYI
ncbi:RidA family protein [Pelorhabdus rhamnosifermentans]|uniref:RidA family protein n=1 Tax=Pelorhabdus rhamnosifermentans TaxID=2772457 RepID=UPI001C061B43